MGKIKLNSITAAGGRVLYDYYASDDLKKYFDFSHPFYIEYDEDITMVPQAILTVPFLANVLPIAWLADAEIVVESVDKSFFESTLKFKQGFQNMYPSVPFAGKLTAENIVDCGYAPSGKTAAFFSGGVDSYCTLIRNIAQTPDLITLWGADISLDDPAGWELVKKSTVETAADFGLTPVFIKSDFNRFVSHSALDGDFFARLNNGWWGGIQHGIGIISHAAPYAWKHGIDAVHFAATLSRADKNVQWASYPTVDGEIKFGVCRVFHDSFDYTRQDKIDAIARFRESTGQPVKLRVCWEAPGGGNCCRCEKCYRTIMGILVSGGNPREYNLAFDANSESLRQIRTLVAWGTKRHISYRYWDPIKQAAVKNKKQLLTAGLWKDVKWLTKVDFSDVENNRYRKRQETVFSLKRAGKKLIPGAVIKAIKK